MPTFTFHYKQTEFRSLEVKAKNLFDAVTKFRDGDGDDQFVSTGSDQIVLSIDIDNEAQ